MNSQFTVTRSFDWLYPPTKNRAGLTRSSEDKKTIIFANSDLFNGPTLICSDLHSHAQSVFTRLDQEIDLSLLNVITAGDMAGDNIYGSDGDPTPTYKFILERAKSLHIVQGNHDLPPIKKADLTKLVNKKNQNGDVTPIYLPEGKLVITDYGKIGGIHGIISYKPHPYKKSLPKYFKYMEELLKKENVPDILITHDTPQFTEDVIGNTKLANLVLDSKHKPKIWIYGHCHHHNFHYQNRDVDLINVDGRVLIINYPEDGKLELNPEMDNRVLESTNRYQYQPIASRSQGFATIEPIPSTTPMYANALKKNM